MSSLSTSRTYNLCLTLHSSTKTSPIWQGIYISRLPDVFASSLQHACSCHVNPLSPLTLPVTEASLSGACSVSQEPGPAAA